MNLMGTVRKESPADLEILALNGPEGRQRIDYPPDRPLATRQTKKQKRPRSCEPGRPFSQRSSLSLRCSLRRDQPEGPGQSSASWPHSQTGTSRTTVRGTQRVTV